MGFRTGYLRSGGGGVLGCNLIRRPQLGGVWRLDGNDFPLTFVWATVKTTGLMGFADRKLPAQALLLSMLWSSIAKPIERGSGYQRNQEHRAPVVMVNRRAFLL